MTGPLFSIPVVFDGGIEVRFLNKNVVVKDQNNKVVLIGIRDTETPPWLIPIGEQELNQMQQLQTIPDVTNNKLVNNAYHQQILPQLTA